MTNNGILGAIMTPLFVTLTLNPSLPTRIRRGVSHKSDSVGGFGTPPPLFTNCLWGDFKGVFRRKHTLHAKIFWWYSFGLDIQSFVLAPDAATFDFVPLC